MLSQLIRNNAIITTDLKTKATKYSDDFKVNQSEQSEDMAKLSKYIKQHVTDPQIHKEIEKNDEEICENPNEFIVEFSDIYKEKEEHLPFFKSIQAQLQAIYG